MSDITAQHTDNGAALLVEKISGVNSAALTWLVPFGHAHDPENQLGRAAVVSEALMRGDQKRDSKQQADAFDRLGATRSIDPSKRFMRFAATVLADRLPELAELFADNLLRPRFEDAAITAAKDLAGQSLASIEDDPQTLAVLGARERHHPAPLNRTGYGTQEGIDAVTRDAAVESWHAAARPEGAIISVAGAVDASGVKSIFDAALAEWKGTPPGFDIGADAPRGYAHREDAEANQVQIVVVHDGPNENDPNAVKERLITAVLSGGMSGRLFTEVREKRGLCYAVSASFAAEKDRGTTTAYVGTTPERAQDSLDVLVEQLLHITTPEGAITPDEFERAVIGMKSRFVFSGESSAARSAAIASDWHRIGRVRSLDEMAAAIDAVTLDELNDYAKTRTLGRVTVQTLGPRALDVPKDIA